MITPSGYVDNAIASNSYVFSMWPPHETATAPLAEFISNSKPRALYALISQNAYYEANYRALEQQLKQSGIKIVGVQRFSENHKDFRSEISRLKKLKADAVIAFLLESGDLSSFFKQAKQLKLPAQIYTANGIPFSEIIRANPGIADDVVYFDFHTPGNQKFLKRYRDTFGMNAGFASARAYDALYILKQAFESCGIESSRLRECIQNTNLSGVTGPVRFDQAGVIANSSNHSYLLKVVSGKFVAIDRPRKYS